MMIDDEQRSMNDVRKPGDEKNDGLIWDTAVQNRTVQDSTVYYGMVWYGMERYGMVWYMLVIKMNEWMCAFDNDMYCL